MVAPEHSYGVARSHRVERVLWLVFVLNLAVAAAKFFYGLASGSAAMQADGIHSVFDSLGNVVGLVGVALAARPADASHPYGHSKFETYASAAIGILLLLAAFEVGSGAVERLVQQRYTADVTVASYGVMVATLVVNLGVTVFERRKGRQLNSQILKADAAHTLSDAFVSIGVLASLGFVSAGFPIADPIMALVVTAFILVAAIEVFRAALRTLSDHAIIPPQEIKALAQDVPGLREVHQVRTRGTEGEVYCDLHALVDPDMSVKAAHDLGDEFEADIKRRFPQVKEVLVHIEPYGFDPDQEDGVALEAQG